MSWSLGEIEALAVKAARGGGKAWGIAEEAGGAVRWLAASGLPGPEALALLLSGRDGICPVELGTGIADLGTPALLDPETRIAEPVLLLPFLAQLTRPGEALEVDLGGTRAWVWAGVASVEGSIPAAAAVRVRGVAHDLPAPALRTRIDEIEPSALETLEAYAARLYAPPTEGSRTRGAGAGLADND